MESNSFTDQTSILVNKHYQKIYDLFKLINVDAIAMPLT